MLEWIRENKRWAQLILVALTLPFACTGIEGYRRMQADSDAVAKVGGQRISRQEFDNAVREQLDRLRQQYGNSLDPKVLDTPQARQSILDQLVTERALVAETVREHVVVSDEQLRNVIAAIPALQEDGKFSAKRYEQLLAAERVSGVEFDARVRKDLTLQKLAGYPIATSVMPKTVSDLIATTLEQERTVATASFTAADFAAKVDVAEDAIKRYYDANQKNFETPEQIDAEYVVLAPQTAQKSVTVSAEDIKQYYDQNQKQYASEEQRRASHILFAVPADAADAVRKATRAKAEGVLAEVRKTPADFAKLARQYSDDPGSKERGGDLDFFGKGSMVKPFEDTVFSLKQGQISDLVQSDFGFHIIQLTGIRPAQIKPLEEVKAVIEAQIRNQLAAKKVAEFAEVFTNTVYEQSDSLKPVADKLGLTIEKVSGLTRTGQQSNPALANPKFIEAIFSADSIRDKRNTPAVETGTNSFIAGHVVNYRARAVRPLAEVRQQVIDAVRKQEALVQANAAGKAALAALNSGKGDAKFAPAIKVSRTSPGGLTPDALRTVFRAPTKKLPAYVGLETPNQGYSIYRVEAVAQAAETEASAAQRKAVLQTVQKTVSEAETDAVVQAIRSRAKVEVLQSLADKDAGKSE